MGPLSIERQQIHSWIQVDIASLEHPERGQIQNAKIEAQRSMLCIPDVELKPLIPRQAVSSVHLSPPGDSWLDRMSEEFASAVIGKIFRQKRARTDQAHVPAKHVEKLWQLIEAGLPEHSPKRRDAMRVELRLTFAVAVYGHCPKFQQRKNPSV